MATNEQAIEAKIANHMDELRKSGTLNVHNWHWVNSFSQNVYITGPETSPYRNQNFLLGIRFPVNYPNNPPLITMKTKIFHPNILYQPAGLKRDDNITLLGEGWTKYMDVSHLFWRLSRLLTVPSVSKANVVNQEAAELFRKDVKEYEKVAREKSSNNFRVFHL